MTPNETSALPGGKPDGWIGVDLDGTLARTDFEWDGVTIGEPIPSVVAGVKALLSQGWDVRIVTARACGVWGQHIVPPMDMAQVKLVEDWCVKHIGTRLPVQFWKDKEMVQLWDDRAVQFAENSGEPLMHAFNMLRGLCVALYQRMLTGSVPAGLVEQLREACGIPKPKPQPLIVEAKSMPKLPKLPAKR